MTSTKIQNNSAALTSLGQMRDGGDVLAVRFWAKAEDDTAWESCVREHAPMIYRIAYSVLRDPHDAEDVAQETFLRGLRSGKLKEVRDARAWLARIAWRTALDHLREEVVPLEAIGEPPASLPGAEDEMLRDERVQIMRDLIRSLPRDLQEVVTLSTVQELSGADVAEILGIFEASVRTRMHRAKELMKEKLAARLQSRSAERS